MGKQLTEKAIERLRIKSTAYVAWDAHQTGLGIKITPAGRRIWVAQLRYPGHEVQTTRTLGQFPGMGLADAREKASKWYGLVKKGVDPEQAEAEERERAAAAARATALRSANTFASVAERYITDRSSNRRAKADAAENSTYAHRRVGRTPYPQHHSGRRARAYHEAPSAGAV